MIFCPPSIRVLEAAEVPPNFTPASPHAPKPIATGSIAAPSVRPFWHAMCGIIPYPLDEDAMQRGSRSGCRRTRFHLVRRGGSGAGKGRRSVECAADFLLPAGNGRRTNSSTPCAATDFCTTWCAIWWGRFFWWERDTLNASDMPRILEARSRSAAGRNRAGQRAVPGERGILSAVRSATRVTSRHGDRSPNRGSEEWSRSILRPGKLCANSNAHRKPRFMPRWLEPAPPSPPGPGWVCAGELLSCATSSACCTTRNPKLPS